MRSPSVPLLLLALSLSPLSAGCRAKRADAARLVEPAASASSTASPSAQPAPSAQAATEAPAAAGDAGPPGAAEDAGGADKPMIASKQFQSWIWEKPQYSSAQIGYLRAGAKIPRAKEPLKTPQFGVQPCGGQWYQVEPFGYVCEGKDGITNNVDDPVVAFAAKHLQPKLEPLPYGYGLVWGTHAYARIPTADEQKQVEGDVLAWRKLMADQRAKMAPEKRPPELAVSVEKGDPPAAIDGHAQVPAVLPWLAINKTVRGGFLMPQTRVAFTAAFDVPFGDLQRTFYLTTEGVLLPVDKVKNASPSTFEGIELGEGRALPMVWVRMPSDKQPATVFRLEPGDGGVELTATKTDVVLKEKGHAFIADKPITVRGIGAFHELLEPPEGLPKAPGARYGVRVFDATRVDVAKQKPDGVKDDEVWVDVDIARQVLVLYKGLTPTFVTLISSGAGGKKRSTPLGHFRVYQKHVTTRMHGDEKPAEAEGEEAERAYRFDDVPWVQYVYQGIALHAAFWHDGFGQPRSHGCINLSPKDAKYVFERTTPDLPKGWHMVNAGRGPIPMGTLVIIHG